MNTLELIKLSKNGDKAARDKLVEDNVRLVWSIVRRFLSRGYEADDLFQIGSIGLIKAIDKFDLTYEVQFSTYAVPMIVGEIRRFIRDDGIIKVSRTLKENAYKANVAREKLTYELSREPTIEEISEYVDIPKEDIVQAYEAVCEVESIYKAVYQNEGSTIYLVDKLEEEQDEHAKSVDRITIMALIDELDEQEKRIIIMRYFEEKTQMEVAKELAVTQVQVSRLEKKILQKLRKKLE